MFKSSAKLTSEVASVVEHAGVRRIERKRLFIVLIGELILPEAVITDTELEMRQPGVIRQIGHRPAIGRGLHLQGRFIPEDGCWDVVHLQKRVS